MTNEEFIQSIAHPGEEWRDVVGYEGLYIVSSAGRLASMHKRKILKQSPQKCRRRAYLHVCLCKDGVQRKTRVYQVVAKAFLLQGSNKDEVDHVNNDPMDNRVENLRWCSHGDNMRNPHTREAERAYKLSHPYSPDTSIFVNKHEDTQKCVVQIKDGRVMAKYKSIGEAARVNDFNKAAISQACNHQRKTYKSFCWMFATEYESQVSMSKN